MLIYTGTKKDFMHDEDEELLEPKLLKALKDKMHRTTPQSEYNSWRSSLREMYMMLNDQNIPEDVGVAIEYNIPQTAKRVDFLLSGYDKNDKANIVVIELKQWQSIEAVKGLDCIVETYIGRGKRKVVHPSYQAWSYATLISDYNQNVYNNDIKIHPCAYLHNYQRKEKNDPLDEKQYQDILELSPSFTMFQRKELKDFVKERIVKGDNYQNILYIDNGKIKPSKTLQDSISSMLKGNKEFIMLDEQKVVYESILKYASEAPLKNEKVTIIVKGGPGTGKSVVAINLLSELTNRGQFVQYVSKNAAPRAVYLKKLKGSNKRSSVNNLFKGSGCYVDAPSNAISTLLCDEAHRLNAKSGMYQNLGENQIKEIINAAYCSVFFIDERQRISTSDIGSIQTIKQYANSLNSKVIEMELVSQFRCNGSNGYLSWLDNALMIKETANYDLEDVDYDFKVFDNPSDLYETIKEKNKVNNKSRLVAGYCWEWPKSGQNNSEVHDIIIDDFSISWNLKNSEAYAIDENSINEAGCIHTVQGLEFDYVGVIIGEDLRYENDKVITDYTKRAKSDRSINGIKKLAQQNPIKAMNLADEIIRNTYRTLMTRGMKGCYIYCTNKDLNEHFKRMINK